MAASTAIEPDKLFNLKSQFWLGNFQAAVSTGGSLVLPTQETKALRDAYVYRAYIAMGNPAVVLDEVPADTPSIALQAVRLFAQYKSEEVGSVKRVSMAQQALEWVSDETKMQDDTCVVVVASILNEEHDQENALRALHGSTTLETLALTCSTLLGMNRSDLAVKCLAQMQAIDDDSVASQLCSIWVNLSLGGSKVQDALQTANELMDVRGSSLVLLNAVGICKMYLNKFAEAEKHFVDAIGMGSNDPETLINLIACAQHQAKPKEFVDRYINQLKRIAPKHQYVLGLESLERVFDRVSGTAAAHK